MVAGIVAVASRVRSHWRWDIVLAAILTALSGYLGASLQGQLFSPVVSVILGLGVGAVTIRFMRARPSILPKLVRTLPWLATGVVSLGLVALGVLAGRERLALAALPDSAHQGPNVLLLVLDTQRADHLGFHGYDRSTSPELDALAEQGTVFENASSSSSWTLPSHASLFTGRPVNQHRAGELRRPFLGGGFVTLAEALAAAGYVTAGFTANAFWAGRQTRLNRGFIHWEDFYLKPGDALVRTVLGRKIAYELLPKFGQIDIPGRMRVEDINRRFFSWLDGANHRPFFAFLNYMDVHGPYLPPEPYAGTFGGSLSHLGKTIDLGAVTDETEIPPPEVLRDWVNRYDESILSLDAGVGDLLAELDSRGLADNTIIVLTSDHGESFGEHGMIFHGNGLHRAQVHVPLIIRYPPAVASGVRDSAAVGIHQIPATIMELAGLSAQDFPAPSVFSSAGREAPVLAEVGFRPQVPASWPTSRGWVKSLTTTRWHFVLHEEGDQELYDLVDDPGESVNLAARAEYADTVQGFRALLTRVAPSDFSPTGR
jgi:arylsulfatase A-like enzyme